MGRVMFPVVTVLAAAVAVADDGRQRGEALDAALVSSRGEPAMLSARRGLPTVLFYEDRHSTQLNQRAKDELFARGKREGLLHAATVIAVANLQGFDWYPARDFALAAVRDTEEKVGIPILVDWHGTLAAPPWSLPPRTSSVLVLDPTGRIVFERSGRLSAADQRELFEVLRRLIAG